MSLCQMLLSACLSYNFLAIMLVVKIFFNPIFVWGSRPRCSRAFDHAHRMTNNTRLCLLLAPRPENPSMPALPLLRSFHLYNSTTRTHASIGASCIPKMHSFFCPTSLLVEHDPCLFPCSCLCFVQRMVALFVSKSFVSYKGFF